MQCVASMYVLVYDFILINAVVDMINYNPARYDDCMFVSKQFWSTHDYF